jgi:ubiquinone/menaquinone biosynthesis C-methylase UbiE
VKRVLNVGGGSKEIPIPAHYDGWDHVLLDIDPKQKPDVVCDARELSSLPAELYDAIYCSHNLEHYWRHDLQRVLTGFHHVLRAHGFVQVVVPDVRAAIEEMARRGTDLDDFLYDSDAGPISVNDVIYGSGKIIAMSGSDFMAHKNAFSPKSLSAVLGQAGFAYMFAAKGLFSIHAYAFKQEPSAEQKQLLGLVK